MHIHQNKFFCNKLLITFRKLFSILEELFLDAMNLLARVASKVIMFAWLLTLRI